VELQEKVKQIPKEYLDILGISFCDKCNGLIFNGVGIMSLPFCFCIPPTVNGSITTSGCVKAAW